ncbi:tRNA preQ1(34) S-adenosylmethionine ribosyltransferase-isomerase QueA [Methyloradius palustris]|uniref:S-adenosylmethionine:tRNA ribosyltransferase-isomerase n=1 Tax=Methyloradius palustris TaxID=2778876 RepID=A0A8D5JVH0_9PROT|nr:tRNA preQ1(34) S-adenosylmethionine ribosyltransferase-isomerase QueA [Methyloradius palustris]BCM24119.1 S-adenosylmethionine:tRNA ribosyltransferase-isomerase [Methyloradius palustris]
MRTTDFDFDLPDALIAQFPTQERSGSRLLRLDSSNGNIHDQLFRDLPNFLQAGDLLVFNDTRVIKARLHGHKQSGGAVEAMIERVIDQHHALAHVRASRSPKPGSRLLLAEEIEVEIIERQDDLFLLKFLSETPLLDLLEQYGALPLPPYISHDADNTDEERYQTVYAKHLGAVAAPTAGLHFDDVMLALLKQQGIQFAYVTLHVGAGTFQPVRVENIAEHKMHSELYSVPEETVKLIKQTQAAGRKVTAIGTTAMRALESAARSGELVAGMGETDIFITPGYKFKVVEQLLTNFHLPKSTLLMLVSAFAGFNNIRQAYAHAISEKYSFFSYGDAMLLNRLDE